MEIPNVALRTGNISVPDEVASDRPLSCNVSVSQPSEPNPIKKLNLASDNPGLLSSVSRKGLKGLKSTLFGLGYTAVILFALAKSSFMHLLANNIPQSLGWVPRATANREITPSYDGYLFDRFFQNHNKFDPVRNIALEESPPRNLDINKTGTILDSPVEIENLRANLAEAKKKSAGTEREKEIEAAITTFDELNTLNQIIWGRDLNPKNLFQGTRPNCQVMGGNQCLILTEKNIQVLKQTIEVTNYDLSEGNFFIDTVVHLQNGKHIPVPFCDLVKWMSPKHTIPSLSSDNSLAIPILTYALEKELTNNYERTFPPGFPSSVPIVLTGNDYSIMTVSPFYLNTLTDQELIRVLSQAPDSPILALSWGSYDDFKRWTSSKLNAPKPFEFLPQSDEKAGEFLLKTKQVAKEVQLGSNTKSSPVFFQVPVEVPKDLTNNVSAHNPGAPSSSTPNPTISNSTTTDTQSTDLSRFPDNHVFVIKGYDPNTKTVTLIDSHGVEYPPLTIDQFREITGAIVVETSHIPPISNETLITYLAALLGIYILRKVSKGINNKFFPPRYGEMLGRRLNEYHQTLQGRRNNNDLHMTTTIEAMLERQKFFTYIALGLLKTAVKNSGLKEDLLERNASFEEIAQLAKYLNIDEAEVHELLIFACLCKDSLEKVKPLTLEHTEQIHDPKSSFYRKLEFWSKAPINFAEQN